MQCHKMSWVTRLARAIEDAYITSNDSEDTLRANRMASCSGEAVKTITLGVLVLPKLHFSALSFFCFWLEDSLVRFENPDPWPRSPPSTSRFGYLLNKAVTGALGASSTVMAGGFLLDKLKNPHLRQLQIAGFIVTSIAYQGPARNSSFTDSLSQTLCLGQQTYDDDGGKC
jgi:hypothetical protein